MIRWLILVACLAGCAPSGYSRKKACSNCPTSTVYRGEHGGMVCKHPGTKRLRRCGGYVYVLVPDKAAPCLGCARWCRDRQAGSNAEVVRP